MSGGGSGTWTAGASGWEDGATAVNWTDGDNAILAGYAAQSQYQGKVKMIGKPFTSELYGVGIKNQNHYLRHKGSVLGAGSRHLFQ